MRSPTIKLLMPLVLFAALIAATLTLLSPTQFVLAATCSGSGCNNTNPNSTGCDVGATTVSSIYPASSRVDLRSSSTCATKWAKTTNTDSLNRSFYANATLKNYYYTHSPAPIAKNLSVYSNQRYNITGQACGYVGPSLINFAVSSPCTP